jgi:hypothetical protein
MSYPYVFRQILDDGPSTVTQAGDSETSVSLDDSYVIITTQPFDTEAQESTSFTFENLLISARGQVTAAILEYSGTTGLPLLLQSLPRENGQATVTIFNGHETEPLDGTFRISIVVVQ